MITLGFPYCRANCVLDGLPLCITRATLGSNHSIYKIYQHQGNNNNISDVFSIPSGTDSMMSTLVLFNSSPRRLQSLKSRTRYPFFKIASWIISARRYISFMLFSGSIRKIGAGPETRKCSRSFLGVKERSRCSNK